jgi:hypothetical protein
MTQLPNGPFNVNDIPPDDRSFEPIPAGVYNLQVIDSRLEDTRSGTGQMLVLSLEVLDGPYQNRKLWDRLNIVNDSVDAMRIANQALAALCQQLGFESITDSEQLHFKPFKGRVRIVHDRTGQYEPQNAVRYNVNPPPGGPQAQPAQGQAQGQGNAQARPQGGAGGARRAQPQQGSRPWNNPQGGQQTRQKNEQGQPFNDKPPF